MDGKSIWSLSSPAPTQKKAAWARRSCVGAKPDAARKGTLYAGDEKYLRLNPTALFVIQILTSLLPGEMARTWNEFDRGSSQISTAPYAIVAGKAQVLFIAWH